MDTKDGGENARATSGRGRFRALLGAAAEEQRSQRDDYWGGDESAARVPSPSDQVRDVRIRRGQLGTLTRLASGGQGVVYAAPSVRMHYASSMVFKEYKPTVLAGLDVSVLEAMPSYLETLPFASGMELLSRAAWPCRLVEDGGAVQGFVMPAIPPEFFMDMARASGVKRTPGEFQHLLNDESFLARRQIPLTDRHRYELLAQVAEALSIFHRHGIAIGDLSPKNLLFSLAPLPKVFFIDCDAMRFQGRSVLPQLETPGWEVHVANPGEELGTGASDAYKLALLALRVLVGDQTTRNLSRLPSSVPRPVRQLIRDGLAPDPSSRPKPPDWVPILAAAASTAATKPPKLPASVQAGASAATRVPSTSAPSQWYCTICGQPNLSNRTSCTRCLAGRSTPPAAAGQPAPTVTGAVPAATPSVTAPRTRTASVASTRSTTRWWKDYDLRLDVKQSFSRIFGVGLLASLIGTIWAPTSLQQVADKIPWLSGLLLLLKITLWTGVPAYVGSLAFDIYMARRGRKTMATAGWPSWHWLLVGVAAVVPPLVVVAVTWGQWGNGKFQNWGGSYFGPPKWFWWLAPACMTVVHLGSLVIRAAKVAVKP